MADVYKSYSDLVMLNDLNAVDSGVSDVLDDAPLMSKLAAIPASDGVFHRYLKEVGGAGAAFRTINVGIPNTTSSDVAVTINLGILDGSFAVDKAAALGYRKGGPEAFVQRELRRKLRATMFKAETQIINGTTNGDASGFTGFADGLNALSNPQVLNAGGTTAGSASSIYLIRTNDLGTDVSLIAGNDGELVVGETVEQRIDDGSTPIKHLTALTTSVIGWMGVQLGSVYSIVRIANVTADTGKGATDVLISKAMALFPASRQPNLCVMGRRSLQQLQASRTVFSPTGAPAPSPTDVYGVPVVVTDGCLSTESLVS
ncbi:MAG: major capsid protein [Janthinobacterium lividum]